MALYAYDHNQAEATSVEINAIINALENTLTAMDSDMRSLGGSWEATEQVEYQGIHRRWTSAAARMRGVLRQVRATLDRNTSNVAETRSAVSRRIAGQ